MTTPTVHRMSISGEPVPLDASRIRVPQCEPGIGVGIHGTDSPALIEGVGVEAIAVWPDDRGHFVEVVRAGTGLAAGFPPETMQVSAAVTYPGVIKAFHYHLRQHDCWTVVAGMLQVALCDLREGSRTFGQRNTFYIGELRPWRLLIPPGVAHGYKVIGAEPAVLVYATSRFYDANDEGRLPYDDPGLAYDWSTQFR